LSVESALEGWYGGEKRRASAAHAAGRRRAADKGTGAKSLSRAPATEWKVRAQKDLASAAVRNSCRADRLVRSHSSGAANRTGGDYASSRRGHSGGAAHG